MRNMMCHVCEILNEFSLSILCITETWLWETDLSVIKAALPAAYSLLHVPRGNEARGGGVAIIYLTSLSGIKVLNSGANNFAFEKMTMSFTQNNKSVKISVIYRPGHPGTDIQFLEEFRTHIEWLQTLSGRIIIVGDYNYWIDSPNMKLYNYIRQAY
jgi:exonuclease III